MFVQGKVNNAIVRKIIQIIDIQEFAMLSKIQYCRKTFPERKKDELRKTNDMSHIAGSVQQRIFDMTERAKNRINTMTIICLKEDNLLVMNIIVVVSMLAINSCFKNQKLLTNCSCSFMDKIIFVDFFI
jgi:hypothetical protein